MKLLKQPVAECVSFMLIRDGQILMEKRRLDKKGDPGRVAIPGGHIETGERHQQALARELKEELNLAAEEFIYLCSLYHPAHELQLLHYYVVEDWFGEMQINEAETIIWKNISAEDAAELEADKIALLEYQRLTKYI